jgi:hypothetical protein
MHQRRNGKRVRHDHHRLLRRLHRLDDRRRPVAQVGVVPLVLLDHATGFEPLRPAALPMARPGVSEAWKDEDFSVCQFHLCLT